MRIRCIKRGKLFLLIIGTILICTMLYTVISLIRKTSDAEALVNYTETLPIYCTDDDTMRIALTINCAWGADDIPDILDTLDHYQVKATFFVVGVWAEQYPEMLQMIYDRGHEIGNHSYSHKLPSKSTAEQLETEIDRCNDVIESILGFRPDLYRAPSGDHTDTLMSLTKQRNLYTIKWSVDSLDWMDRMSADDVINRVTGKIHSGAIILCHNDTQHTASVLPEILAHLQKEGYQFVTVSKLIYRDNYIIDSQGTQRKKP